MTLPKRIASVVLAFIICVCVVICVLCISVINTVGSADFWLKCCDKTGYYEKCAEVVVSRMKEISTPSGIPQDEFDGVVTSENVKSDAEKQFVKSAAGETFAFDTAWLETELMSRFTDYAENNGYELTEEVNEGLEEFAGYCVDEYETACGLEYYSMAVKYVNDYKPYIMKAFYISLAIAVCAAGVCVFGARKHCPRYLGYAFLGAAGMAECPYVVYKISKLSEKLVFDPEYSLKLLFGMINGLFDALSYAAIGLFFAGVLSVIISEFLKEK